ncbi:MAG: xanthine/uracil/vitamin C permease, partial [Sarcina sp.]
MLKKGVKIPFFTTGDIGGLTYTITNNIVNYLIVIATLSGVLGWPDELVYGRVIPGMSIGLLLSGLYYAYMAYKLGQKEGRSDVTALPSGVSTPAMFVILYGVIMPLHYALGDPELTWSAAVAACFIGGMVEFLGGFIGPWMKKRIPRAALLGTVAGIGFIWMATQGVFDVFADPVVGLPILLVAMVGVFGGYLFPKRIPPLVVAIVGGIIYAFLLGRTSFDFSGVGFYFPNPASSIEALINGFTIVAPYLTIIIPIEIYNFVETMDNIEAANAAGDNYSIREAQFVDGICTMASALFGGVVPNTVWLGHAGLKKSGAGIGFSWVGGILLGLAGTFGLFTLFSAMVPPAICAITYLWCSVIMVSQAFK